MEQDECVGGCVGSGGGRVSQPYERLDGTGGKMVGEGPAGGAGGATRVGGWEVAPEPAPTRDRMEQEEIWWVEGNYY